METAKLRAKMTVILVETGDEKAAQKAAGAFNRTLESYGDDAQGVYNAEVVGRKEFGEWWYYVRTQIYYPKIMQGKGMEALVQGWRAAYAVIYPLWGV